MTTDSRMLRRLAAASAAGGLVFFVLVYLLITNVTQTVELSLSNGRADSYLDILRKTQGFYFTYVVGNATKNGIAVSRNVEGDDPAIPLPATFMHGLVQELSLKDKDLDFRFFSPLPFSGRADGGIMNDFDKKAWAAFLANPEMTKFSEVSSVDGTRSLSYAMPVRMGKNCVGCHNSHVDSPRTDWKVGDLRGVQAVTMPLGSMGTLTQGRLSRFAVLLIAGLSLLFGAFVCGLWLLMTRNNQLNTAKEKIEDLAMRDSLTNHFNRRYFLAELNTRLRNDSKPFSVCILDLDNFKVINDVHGHMVGDEVLKQVAERLSNIAVESVALARFGGDEFAILTETCDEVALGALAQKIVKELARPYMTASGPVHSGCSIGITQFPICATTEIELLTQADLALIEAKGMGRGQYVVFGDELREEMHHGVEMGSQIREALKYDQFEMFYQPKFDIRTGKILGLEALIRWRHPERGLLSPGSILPYAEANGLMSELSCFVSEQVVRDLNDWIDRGLTVPPVAVNLHRDYMCDRERFFGFIDRISKTPKLAGLLVFEITEDCVIGRGHDEIMIVISAIKAAGFQLSLDDFGTGFASLTHLKSLPVDEFKIDRSFVRDIETDAQDMAIVQTLVELSESLHLRVVAEGIETDEQARLLQQMGCQIGQGFLFSKPVDRESIFHLLRMDGQQVVLPYSASRGSSDMPVEGKVRKRIAAKPGNCRVKSLDADEELPIVDDAALDSIAGPDGSESRELMCRAISLFQKNAPRAALNLAETACQDELQDVADAARALKALCDTIGAKRLEVACKRLESVVTAGQTGELPLLLANLQRRLTEVIECIGERTRDREELSASA